MLLGPHRPSNLQSLHFCINKFAEEKIDHQIEVLPLNLDDEVSDKLDSFGYAPVTTMTMLAKRRRGIQSAVISARANMAMELGCRFLFSFTAHAVTSKRNLVRKGLNILCEKSIWKRQTAIEA